MTRATPEPLTPAQQQLVASCHALACCLAQRFHRRRRGDLDDWQGRAYEGLIRAAQLFEPERGIKFITYAYRSIVLYLLRPEPRRPVCFSDHFADGGLWQWASAVADDAEPVADAIERAAELGALATALERLPARERAVVEGHFLAGKPLAQLGRELGISRPRVAQIEMRALVRLRGFLTGERVVLTETTLRREQRERVQREGHKRYFRHGRKIA